MIGDGLDGQGEIGPRISIGHRKDIDAIQLPSLLLCVVARCQKRAPQARAIHIADSHDGRKIGTGLVKRNKTCQISGEGAASQFQSICTSTTLIVGPLMPILHRHLQRRTKAVGRRICPRGRDSRQPLLDGMLR